MARFNYFTDLPDGTTIKLANVWHQGTSTTKAANFSGWGPDGLEYRCTRYIEMKPMPSRHECDSRCVNATGRIMKCECSCGGKNHGKGSSIKTALKCE